MPTEPSGPERELVEIRFSSTLPLVYRDELERIVFFNPDQHRVADSLLAAVSHFGAPSIVQDGNSLRFSVPAFGPGSKPLCFGRKRDARSTGWCRDVRTRP